MTKWTAFTLVLCLSACGDNEQVENNEGAEEVEAPEPEPEVSPAESEELQGSPEVEIAQVEPETGAEVHEAEAGDESDSEVEVLNNQVLNDQGEDAELAAELEEANRQVEAALTEAEAAESGESDACERAYVGLTAVLERIRETHAEQTRQMPEHEAFMSVCAELPEGMRDCLAPTYAVQHQSLCAERAEALSEQERTSLETMLGG